MICLNCKRTGKHFEKKICPDCRSKGITEPPKMIKHTREFTHPIFASTWVQSLYDFGVTTFDKPSYKRIKKKDADGNTLKLIYVTINWWLPEGSDDLLVKAGERYAKYVGEAHEKTIAQQAKA